MAALHGSRAILCGSLLVLVTHFGCAQSAASNTVTAAPTSSPAAITATRSPVGASPALVRVPTTASPAALAEFHKARAAHEAGRGTEAVAAYTRAIEIDPAFAQAYMFRGGTGASDSERDFARARQLAAQLPEVERLWIEAFIVMHGSDAAAARAAMARLVAVAGSDPFVVRWQLQLEMSLGNPQGMVAAARRLVELEPAVAAHHHDLALAYVEAGDLPQALTAGARLIELSPRDPAAHDTQGAILLAANRLEDAERAFRRVIALDANAIEAYLGIAAIRLQRGDEAGARAALVVAPGAVAEPIQVRLARKRAWLDVAAGRPREAIATIDGLRGSSASTLALAFDRTLMNLIAAQWKQAMSAAPDAIRATERPSRFWQITIALAAAAHAGARDLATADRRIAELEASSPSALELANARIHLQIARKDLAGAEAALDKLTGPEAEQPERVLLARLTLVRAALAAHDRPRATRVLAALQGVPTRVVEVAAIRHLAEQLFKADQVVRDRGVK